MASTPVSRGGTPPVRDTTSDSIPSLHDERQLLMPFTDGDAGRYGAVALNDGSEDGDDPPAKQCVAYAAGRVLTKACAHGTLEKRCPGPRWRRGNIVQRYPKTFVALAVGLVLAALTLAVVIPQVASGASRRHTRGAACRRRH